jgi:hypothetical protein
MQGIALTFPIAEVQHYERKKSAVGDGVRR